jgi:hypothetical protein
VKGDFPARDGWRRNGGFGGFLQRVLQSVDVWQTVVTPFAGKAQACGEKQGSGQQGVLSSASHWDALPSHHEQRHEHDDFFRNGMATSRALS